MRIAKRVALFWLTRVRLGYATRPRGGRVVAS